MASSYGLIELTLLFQGAQKKASNAGLHDGAVEPYTYPPQRLISLIPNSRGRLT